MSDPQEKRAAFPPNPQLGETFDPLGFESWKALAEAQLKGADYDRKLRTKLPDGLTIEPLYVERGEKSEASAFPAAGDHRRGDHAAAYRTGPWRIAQELPYSTPEELNRTLHHDLGRGLTAVNVLLDLATQAGRDPDQAEVGEVGACGVSLTNEEDLAHAFNQIDFTDTPLLIANGATPAFASLLIAWAQDAQQDLPGSLNFDPFDRLIRTGKLSRGLEAELDDAADLTTWAAEAMPKLRTLGASATAVADAGGSAPQELASLMATAVTYLRELAERGIDPTKTAARLSFNVALGTRTFLEIAKLRACRVLWNRIAEAFGIDTTVGTPVVHARTGFHNQTVADPYVNMLRGTTEAFSAAIGGVDSLHVSAFDEIQRVPDAFSQRIARNTQIVLAEECELLGVADPAGGSYFIETLTDQLAEQAWALFQRIEGEGGWAQTLAAGWFQTEVGEVAAARRKRIHQRRDVIVGVNQYANAKEEALKPNIPDYHKLKTDRAAAVSQRRVAADETADAAILESLERVLQSRGERRLSAAVDAARQGATVGELHRVLVAATSRESHPLAITPLKPQRAAGDYENLRQAARNLEVETGAPPAVFLANLGPTRKHKLRADFTRSFLEPAGFAVDYTQGFDTVEAAAEAASQSPAKIIFICGRDDQYPDFVADLCRTLKADGRQRLIYLAGDPGEHAEAWKEAGLDGNISIKSNNYETLRELLSFAGAHVSTKS